MTIENDVPPSLDVLKFRLKCNLLKCHNFWAISIVIDDSVNILVHCTALHTQLHTALLSHCLFMTWVGIFECWPDGHSVGNFSNSIAITFSSFA